MRRGWFGVAVVAVVAVAACATPVDPGVASDDDRSPQPSADASADTGGDRATSGGDTAAPPASGSEAVDMLATDGSWVLEAGTVDGADLSLVDGAMVTLVPAEGQFSGRAACNEYSADYDVQGDDIQIGLAGQTEMACDERRMGVEAAYLAALPRVTTVDRSDGRLTLSGDGVKMTFVEQAPLATNELVGTRWELESVGRGDVVSTVAGDGFLQLDPDGTMTGSTGCRTLTGDWRASGSNLTFPMLAADGDCPPDLVEQDARVVGVLEDAGVTVDGDRLTLTSRHGEADGETLVYQAPHDLDEPTTARTSAKPTTAAGAIPNRSTWILQSGAVDGEPLQMLDDDRSGCSTTGERSPDSPPATATGLPSPRT